MSDNPDHEQAERIAKWIVADADDPDKAGEILARAYLALAAQLAEAQEQTERYLAQREVAEREAEAAHAQLAEAQREIERLREALEVAGYAEHLAEARAVEEHQERKHE